MKVRDAVRILDGLEPPAWLEGEIPPVTDHGRPSHGYYAPDGTPINGDPIEVWRIIEERKASDPANHLKHEWMMDNGFIHLSTVYLGLNHGFTPGLPIRIFETMIFGFADHEYQWRYATRAAAHAGHDLIRDALTAILDDPGTDVTRR